MNQEIKAQWVAALRSGEYRQGSGFLRSGDNEFCCLGVLCDLAVKAKLHLNITILNMETQSADPDPNTRPTYKYDNDTMTLPFKVCDWAGLQSSNPYVSLTEEERRKLYSGDAFACPPSSHITLAGCNDNGLTFEDIATVIEREL